VFRNKSVYGREQRRSEDQQTTTLARSGKAGEKGRGNMGQRLSLEKKRKGHVAWRQVGRTSGGRGTIMGEQVGAWLRISEGGDCPLAFGAGEACWRVPFWSRGREDWEGVLGATEVRGSSEGGGGRGIKEEGQVNHFAFEGKDKGLLKTSIEDKMR